KLNKYSFSDFNSRHRSRGMYLILSTPKSGSPVLGQTEVSSGSSISISYLGNWFCHVSIAGKAKSNPAFACSSVYLWFAAILVLYEPERLGAIRFRRLFPRPSRRF